MGDIQTQLPIKITNGTQTVNVTASNALQVDNSSVTQPVTGTVSIIPSGTQTVAGTVTQVPSGTQTVTGTVVTSPTGTQAVSGNVGVTGTVSTIPTGTQTVAGTVVTSGTVTQVPSGTQTVTGTVTNVPSGTQNVAVTGTATVTGTVSTIPTGTQTVAGTIVNTPNEQTSGAVCFYGTSATIGVGATATISYSVTAGKTNYLKGVLASSSGGPCRVQVQSLTGTVAAIQFVGFYSAASPLLKIPFFQPPGIAAGSSIQVLIQNNANAIQDVYASIMGHEI